MPHLVHNKQRTEFRRRSNPVLLLLTLNRVFLERVGRSWALDFQQHYDYLAVVLGIGACFALMAFAARGIAVVAPSFMSCRRPSIGINARRW